MQCIRVGAFDESPLLRAGIVQVLNAETGMEVVAEAGSAAEALHLSAKLAPDVVILDARLLEDGIKIARSIAALPGVKMLVLASTPDERQVAAAFAAGARGYVLKGAQGHEFRAAVRAVHRGEAYLSPALAGDMMLRQTGLPRTAKPANANPIGKLTHREGQIFKLLADGLTNREIGGRLNMSEKSVKRYVTRIFETLGVRNRVEAAMMWRGSSIPEPSSCNASTVRSPGPILPWPSASGDRQPVPAGGDPSATHCFSAVFGRIWLSAQDVDDVQQDARVSGMGTHILL